MDAIAPGRGRSCPSPHAVLEYISTFSESALTNFGSFSPAIYDSAWLSMVYNSDRSSRFPQCFEHLLSTQNEDGTWTSYGSQIDGILNTLASLLALTVRLGMISGDMEKEALRAKMVAAEQGLKKLLCEWEVEMTVHVGFEILVTSLLQQLEAVGIKFEFPGRPKLKAVFDRKMAKFTPDLVHTNVQSTLLHSVEALVGLINFDTLEQHCTEVSGILGSPSATAAYLIHSTKWDERAEKYLERVLIAYGNNGKVPSAFPTPIFEISWALSNLLSQTEVGSAVTSEEIFNIVSFLERTIMEQNGIVGFGPGLLPDADDTARTLMTLKVLGRSVHPEPMVTKFEKNDHFQTYENERNPSISANCNVLLALLELDSIGAYMAQMTKILSFLLGKWSSSETSDKWNVSQQYLSMLMAECFVRTLRRYNQENSPGICSAIVLKQIPAALCQMLLRTLKAQQPDGSWSSSLEETAYSIIMITQCRHLPLDQTLISHLEKAVASAREFISTRYSIDESNHHFWVEKTTYQSQLLKIGYCSTALYCKEPQLDETWNSEIASSFSAEKQTKELRMLVTGLPMFQKFPITSVDLVLLETKHAAQSLREARHMIMDRDSTGFTKDKYLEYIPVIWHACNGIDSHAVSPRVIRDMVLLSLFNYQIDEYMESVIVDVSPEDLEHLCIRIQAACGLMEDLSTADELGSTIEPQTRRKNYEKKVESTRSASNTNGSGYDELHEPSYDRSSYESILTVLRRYIAHILNHPSVLQAPSWTQRCLAVELHNYLIGQINHNRDNHSFVAFKTTTGKVGFSSTQMAQSTYWKWVNTTGSDDTSCPISWHFFVCLISKAGETCLDGTLARYYSESLVRHLAVLCRQYNDFGSATRDAEEETLNSINFAEFCHRPRESYVDESQHRDAKSSEEAKINLMTLAEFERSQMELSLKFLNEQINDRTISKQVQVFVNVTDTFGQIYVMKDIASRNKAKQK